MKLQVVEKKDFFVGIFRRKLDLSEIIRLTSLDKPAVLEFNFDSNVTMPWPDPYDGGTNAHVRLTIGKKTYQAKTTFPGGVYINQSYIDAKKYVDNLQRVLEAA